MSAHIPIIFGMDVHLHETTPLQINRFWWTYLESILTLYQS